MLKTQVKYYNKNINKETQVTTFGKTGKNNKYSLWSSSFIK